MKRPRRSRENKRKLMVTRGGVFPKPKVRHRKKKAIRRRRKR